MVERIGSTEIVLKDASVHLIQRMIGDEYT